jgi:ubiquinone/menaquinone biosynthesis C-methylase UbiE
MTPVYDSPSAWSAGPDLVYGALAAAAMALLVLPGEALTLDAGAGTGAFARALRRAGATVVEVDTSAPMLRHDAAARPRRVVGDLTALPLREHCFDAAVAGFVLSHLPDPGRGLSELVRVTRPGGIVVATSFPAGPAVPGHPVKVAIDHVLTRYGYQPPDWYLALKTTGEARVGEQAALESLGAAAGLHHISVDQVSVDIDDIDDSALVRWRLGMAQVAPWVQAQEPARQADITDAAGQALEAIAPVPLPMLVLRGRSASR